MKNRTPRAILCTEKEIGMSSHLLSWIVFTPLLGAFILLCVPKRAAHLIRWIALGTTALTAVLVCLAFPVFRASEPGFQLVERVMWIPQFGVQYLLGVDGISFPMIVLTALISLMACLGSLTHIRVKGGREKEYYFLFLLLETGMMGTFLASTFSVLHFLGSGAGPDVLLIGIGAACERICRDQIFPVHARGKSLHATWHSCRLLRRPTYV